MPILQVRLELRGPVSCRIDCHEDRLDLVLRRGILVCSHSQPSHAGQHKRAADPEGAGSGTQRDSCVLAHSQLAHDGVLRCAEDSERSLQTRMHMITSFACTHALVICL